jgi:hypothetical protein
MRLAKAPRMLNDRLAALFAEIHHNVDRLCDDLQFDRPDLAAAVRQRASCIPRPEELVPKLPAPPHVSAERLGPLLYDALDEGVIDSRQFDALMIDRTRARRLIAERAPR